MPTDKIKLKNRRVARAAGVKELRVGGWRKVSMANRGRLKRPAKRKL